jgi:hypothetical protein
MAFKGKANNVDYNYCSNFLLTPQYVIHIVNEGNIYVSSLAVLHQENCFYTYWYDHAPLGWLFAAGWHGITGGMDIAVATVNAGRIFMLVLQLCSRYFYIKLR